MTLLPILRSEGHEVVMYLHSGSRIGDGVVFKTDDPHAIAEQADLIIFDDNGLGKMADQFRAKGFNVWNGGTWAERLEYDRVFGMTQFRDCGITIPDTFEVSSIGDIRSCISTEFRAAERVVIKLDSSEFAGSCMSFVAKDREQLLETAQHWVDEGKLGKSWSGIIQRFVKGIEVSTEGWWNGESFSNHNITIEEKKLLPGNFGPAVGCSFNTIASISANSRLFKLVVEPLEQILRDSGYVGQIDTNAIVDEDGTPYALEFTPRCGYEATPTLAWGTGRYGHAVAAALGIESEAEMERSRRGRFWCATRMYVPPYPFSSHSDDLSVRVYEECAGVPVSVPDHLRDDFLPYDVMEVDGELVCAGTCGIVGIALGGGNDVESAGKACYEVAEQVSVPNVGFRALDGWKRAKRDIDSLQAMRLISIP